MIRFLFLVITIFTVLFSQSYSQCSDAGVCSIGHIEPESGNSKANQFGITYIFGYSTPDDEVVFHTIRIDGTLKLIKSTFIHMRLPFLAVQDGPAGSVSGIGDAIISLQHEVFQFGDKGRLGLHAGLKLATGDANKNDHLPQIYQPGLGTNDLLFGINYGIQAFDLMIGYQLVENKRNDNSVTRLKRGDDFMAQFSYSHTFENISVIGKLLIIKRLEQSSVLQSGSNPDQFYTVPKSDQLQINLDASIIYRINQSLGIRGQLVSALLSRDVNVDGLTRGVTLALGGIFSF